MQDKRNEQISPSELARLTTDYKERTDWNFGEFSIGFFLGGICGIAVTCILVFI